MDFSDHFLLEVTLRLPVIAQAEKKQLKNKDKWLLKDLASGQRKEDKIAAILASDWPNSSPSSIITEGIRPRMSNPYLYEPKDVYEEQKKGTTVTDWFQSTLKTIQ